MKTRTQTKTVWRAYARSPQVQCIYALSRLSVRSIAAWRTNKQTKKQKKQTKKRQTNKKNDKLGLLALQGVDPATQIFRVCRGGGTLHISSKHYMGQTPFYGARAEKPPKKPILPWSKRIYVAASGDINKQSLKSLQRKKLHSLVAKYVRKIKNSSKLQNKIKNAEWTSTSVLMDQELASGRSGSMICQPPVAVARQSTGANSLRFDSLQYAACYICICICCAHALSWNYDVISKIRLNAPEEQSMGYSWQNMTLVRFCKKTAVSVQFYKMNCSFGFLVRFLHCVLFNVYGLYCVLSTLLFYHCFVCFSFTCHCQ